MPTVITPTSVVLPATFNAPVDGEPRNAASVNDALQTLGDGVLYATTKAAADTAVVQAEVDELEAVVTLPDFRKIALAGSLQHAFYNAALYVHYVVGQAGKVHESTDGGQTWAARGDIGADDIYEGVSSDDGVTVLATGTENIYKFNSPAYGDAPFIVDARAAMPGTILSAGSISYDSVSDLFLWFTRSTTPGFIMSTSPGSDGVTWTARSVGTFSSFTAKTLHKIATDGEGRTVLALGGGTDTQIFYSDNGGVTWTNAGALPHGFTTASLSLSMTVDGDFLLAASAATGGDSEVWLSLNGVAWTKKTTFLTTQIYSITSYVGTWIGLAFLPAISTSAIIFSRDEGATWYTLPAGLSTLMNAIVRSCGRIVIAADAAAYASQYLSTPVLTATS